MSTPSSPSIASLVQPWNERAERYRKLLPETDDVSLIVLKGHLIVEEMLFEVVRSHCVNPEYVPRARLTFAQLVQLSRAMAVLPVDENFWRSIELLNTIRNALVHNLEPHDIAGRIDTLAKLCLDNESVRESGLTIPDTPHGKASLCAGFLLGALSVAGPAAEILRDGHRLQPGDA